jgi:hypothetical protein
VHTHEQHEHLGLWCCLTLLVQLEQERIKQNQRKKEMNKSYGLTSNMLEEGEFDDGTTHHRTHHRTHRTR